MNLLSVALILFFIMDPLGSISAFLKMLKDLPPKRQAIVLFREMLLALGVTLFAYFIGNELLYILDVKEVPVRLSSGIILFLVAIKILFPQKPGLRESYHVDGDSFLVPIAIPMIAGPALLATVILFAGLPELHDILLPAILTAWAAACAVLLLSRYLKQILGTNGLLACERLMGMILVLLAIQRFFEGIQMFFASQATSLAVG